MGFGDGVGSREKYGLHGGGPSKVITNLGILEPDPKTLELTMTHLHPGVSKEQVIENTGWELKFSQSMKITEQPKPVELTKIRELIKTSDR
jgi:glutaconate CoA-transferase subunit B